MEPLVALGLAANIAQFLELGTKTFRHAREFADSGTTVSATHLGALATDMKGFSTQLQSQYTSLVATAQPEEKALCDLALRCAETAGELQDALTKIARQTERGKAWNSVLAALRTTWNSGRIDSLVNRLSDSRGRLTVQLLVVLNKHFMQQKGSLESLRDEIVEVVSINSHDLKATLGRQETAVGAIFKLQSGAFKAINSRKGPSADSDEPEPEPGNASITYIKEGCDGDKGAPNANSFVIRSKVSDYVQKITAALHFRGIQERHSLITSAHQKTFEWVWEDSDRATWDPLSPWLSDPDPLRGRLYWVSGKPGSGKSSLMKYLEKDKRLDHRLQKWVGSSKLIIASFYFWYAGTPLQKSHDGLIRGILRRVLHKQEELALLLFPDLCSAIINGRASGNLEISHSELRVAFTNLVQHVPSNLRICLLIDGIDEYAGDANEICDLLLQAVENPSIKALVSSRPIPACYDRLRRYQGLRMQDLTGGDISLYISETLVKHHVFTRMKSAEKDAMASIVAEIKERASGVFLWVVIVVRNLILKLQDYEDKDVLLEEVKKLPPDLEKLYDHMLGSISKASQVQASKILQLLLRNMDIPHSSSLTLLRLSFAVEDDYETCVTPSLQTLSKEACDWRCESTEGRLRSRCCGLCEVRDTPERDVVFIHRTVVEFLKLGTIWDKLIRLTSETAFDVDLALMSSVVAVLRATPPEPWVTRPNKLALNSLEQLLHHGARVAYGGRMVRTSRKTYFDRYLVATNRALTIHWHDARYFVSPEQELDAVESSYRRLYQRLKPEYPYSLNVYLSLQSADVQGMSKLVNTFPSHKTRNQEIEGPLLLQHVLDEPQGPIRLALARSVQAGILSLRHGGAVQFPDVAAREAWNNRWKMAAHADLNPNNSWSPWEYLLHHCYSVYHHGTASKDHCGSHIFPHSKALLIVITVMIKHHPARYAAQKISIMSTESCRGSSSGEITQAPCSGSGRVRVFPAWAVVQRTLKSIWLCKETYSQEEVDEIANLSWGIERWFRLANDCGLNSHKTARNQHRYEEAEVCMPEAVLQTKTEAISQRKLSWKKRLSFFKSKGKKHTLDVESKPMEDVTASTEDQEDHDHILHDPGEDIAPSSPWLLHLEQRSHTPAHRTVGQSRNTAEPEPAASSLSRQNTWEQRSRSNRLALLSAEHQKMAIRLVNTTPENAVFELRELPYAVQESVIECMEVMRTGEEKHGVGTKKSQHVV